MEKIVMTLCDILYESLVGLTGATIIWALVIELGESLTRYYLSKKEKKRK